MAVDCGREKMLSVWQWQWGHLLGKVAVSKLIYFIFLILTKIPDIIFMFLGNYLEYNICCF